MERIDRRPRPGADRWGILLGSQETIMTGNAPFKRRVRARMARTGESYATARVRLLAGRSSATLHVTNGDSAAGTLRRIGLAGRVLPWRDALHAGPVPAVGDRELRRVRAGFLAGEDPADRGRLQRWLAHRDRTLLANRDGEYLLWFEADLYDQLQLAQILAALGELGVPPERITLVCIGEYPGVAHFGGLGELGPEQLQGLLGTAAVRLGPAAMALAGSAWAALRAPEPGGLGAIAATASPELRFLGEAFDRLSREYPSTRDGLSLTERRILAASADGARTAGEVFARVGAREARPYLGDLFCFQIVAGLARARTPLLAAEPPTGAVGAGTGVRPTAAGRRVLGGDADQVALNGIDRWIGGVHLAGPDSPWRWDEGTESIVAVPDR
jgi:hypothetical protein